MEPALFHISDYVRRFRFYAVRNVPYDGDLQIDCDTFWSAVPKESNCLRLFSDKIAHLE